jgi:hypothetical protein
MFILLWVSINKRLCFENIQHNETRNVDRWKYRTCLGTCFRRNHASQSIFGKNMLCGIAVTTNELNFFHPPCCDQRSKILTNLTPVNSNVDLFSKVFCWLKMFCNYMAKCLNLVSLSFWSSPNFHKFTRHFFKFKKSSQQLISETHRTFLRILQWLLKKSLIYFNARLITASQRGCA